MEWNDSRLANDATERNLKMLQSRQASKRPCPRYSKGGADKGKTDNRIGRGWRSPG